MLDEREGNVKPEELSLTFNQQPLYKRAAILLGGPFFNFLLAFLLFWWVLVLGEQGWKPVVAKMSEQTIAYKAGFNERDTILAVGDVDTPTWTDTLIQIYMRALSGERDINIKVEQAIDKKITLKTLSFPDYQVETPNALFEYLGLEPWLPDFPAAIGRVDEKGAAFSAGLLVDDHILAMDGEPVIDWLTWSKAVSEKPGEIINLQIDRSGRVLHISFKVDSRDTNEGKIGIVGVAAKVPDAFNDLKVSYSLSVADAIVPAFDRVLFNSTIITKVLGLLVIGEASIENISGPVGIAQAAGETGRSGLVKFLKFLALISVSIGVVNLFPIPVFDGGQLLLNIVESIKGSPFSDKAQLIYHRTGLVMLICLLGLTVVLDIARMVD